MEGTQTPGPSAQTLPSSLPPTHAQPGAEAEWVRLRPSPAPLCGELGLGLGLPFRPHRRSQLCFGGTWTRGKFKSLASGSL